MRFFVLALALLGFGVSGFGAKRKPQRHPPTEVSSAGIPDGVRIEPDRFMGSCERSDTNCYEAQKVARAVMAPKGWQVTLRFHVRGVGVDSVFVNILCPSEDEAQGVVFLWQNSDDAVKKVKYWLGTKSCKKAPP